MCICRQPDSPTVKTCNSKSRSRVAEGRTAGWMGTARLRAGQMQGRLLPMPGRVPGSTPVGPGTQRNKVNSQPKAGLNHTSWPSGLESERNTWSGQWSSGACFNPDLQVEAPVLDDSCMETQSTCTQTRCCLATPAAHPFICSAGQPGLLLPPFTVLPTIPEQVPWRSHSWSQNLKSPVIQGSGKLNRGMQIVGKEPCQRLLSCCCPAPRTVSAP